MLKAFPMGLPKPNFNSNIVYKPQKWLLTSNTLAKMDFCYITKAFLPWYYSFAIYYFIISHPISFLSLAAIYLSVLLLWKFVNLLWFSVILLWKFVNLLVFFVEVARHCWWSCCGFFFLVLVWFQLSRK